MVGIRSTELWAQRTRLSVLFHKVSASSSSHWDKVQHLREMFHLKHAGPHLSSLRESACRRRVKDACVNNESSVTNPSVRLQRLKPRASGPLPLRSDLYIFLTPLQHPEDPTFNRRETPVTATHVAHVNLVKMGFANTDNSLHLQP